MEVPVSANWTIEIRASVTEDNGLHQRDSTVRIFGQWHEDCAASMLNSMAIDLAGAFIAIQKTGNVFAGGSPLEAFVEAYKDDDHARDSSSRVTR